MIKRSLGNNIHSLNNIKPKNIRVCKKIKIKCFYGINNFKLIYCLIYRIYIYIYIYIFTHTHTIFIIIRHYEESDTFAFVSELFLLHRDVAKETRCHICSDTATLECMSSFLKGQCNSSSAIFTNGNLENTGKVFSEHTQSKCITN